MVNDTRRWRGWREAAGTALYGPEGFFVRERPAAHFRTSVHASPLFASAVAELLRRVDEALGRPDALALVDVGAGRGELLEGVLAQVSPELRARLRPYAVERAARPAGLDPRIAWHDELPEPGSVTGLVFANEWLDNVPLEVAEAGPDGVLRRVLVAADGEESPGEAVTGADAAWLTRWWPSAGKAEPDAGNGTADGTGAEAESDAGVGTGFGAGFGAGVGTGSRTGGVPASWAASENGAGNGTEPEPVGAEPTGAGPAGTGPAGAEPGAGAGSTGTPALRAEPGLRAEIGAPRDEAWARAVGCLRRGLAVAVDYAHTREDRPLFGTLTGFRDGREVRPVPDGSCDITAHVALDACAAAGATVAGTAVAGTAVAESGAAAESGALDGTALLSGGPSLLTQRDALHALGVDGRRPPLALASTDPGAYVRALSSAGEAAELTDPSGLGAFGWLIQPVAR
ncbi:SAM-dependent methyltransferase [Streptomyces sp. NPDC001922]|uniref:SAM-dependent methyltransferase n=1 Tax=Streptomyces sp. NPDC001922 TaxID=3364624 RepID=UPI003689315B